MNARRVLLAAAAVVAICGPALSQTKPTYGSWGYDPAAMDAAVKPGDDFFGFVNGSWAKHTEIAPDRTFVGIDSVLHDQTDKNVRAIVRGGRAGTGKLWAGGDTRRRGVAVGNDG